MFLFFELIPKEKNIYDWIHAIVCMRSFICLLSLLIVVMIFSAGCTHPQLGPASSSGDLGKAGIQSPDTHTGSSAQDQYPAPPEDNAVSAQINEKDQLDKTIPVFFSGGKGQKMVKSSWIVLTRSDGSSERFELPPKAQSEVILQGTDGEDLVRVYAEYYDGNQYQIAEKSVRLRQRL
ncbi:MAG: hypothetical protein LUQ50_05275 [Methanospirillum sp.]|uniref:hypothetical protein n=1 Tax=Methanospirillum sp. TaxID=45200 RepID=UPI00237261C6|nr:hypothetical protein [Methanospirillum sp.]MDD1728464.1 hypothetical protein [Methanospirillum sp.]